MDQRKETRSAWGNVLVSFFLMALVYFTVMSSLGLFTLSISEDLGFLRSQFSIVITMALVGMTIGSLAAGSVFEKFSVKKVVFCSVIVVGLSFMALSLVSSLALFAAIAFAGGFFAAWSTTIPVSVLINSWFAKKNKGLAMGIAVAGTGVGSMVLTVIIVKTIEMAGWRTAFRSMGLMVLVVLIPLILIFLREKEKVQVPTETEQTKAAAPVAAGYEFKEAIRLPAFWVLFFVYVSYSISSLSAFANQMPFYTDLQMDPAKALMFVTASGGAITVGKLWMGVISDKLGEHAGFIIGLAATVVMFASFLGAFYHENFIWLYVIGTVFSAGLGTVCLPLMSNYLFGEKCLGKMMGALGVAVSLGSGIGPLVANGLFDATGSYQVAWTIMLGVSVLQLLCAIWLVNKKRSYRYTHPAE